MTDRQKPLTPDRYPPLEVGPYMLTNYGPPQEAPCAYCGSVNGETPPSAYALDPLTGDTIRVAIDAACDLSNPRLSEVDWDAVGGALGLRVCNKPEDHLPARQEAADTSGLRARWERDWTEVAGGGSEPLPPDPAR